MWGLQSILRPGIIKTSSKEPQRFSRRVGGVPSLNGIILNDSYIDRYKSANEQMYMISIGYQLTCKVRKVVVLVVSSRGHQSYSS